MQINLSKVMAREICKHQCIERTTPATYGIDEMPDFLEEEERSSINMHTNARGSFT